MARHKKIITKQLEPIKQSIEKPTIQNTPEKVNTIFPKANYEISATIPILHNPIPIDHKDQNGQPITIQTPESEYSDRMLKYPKTLWNDYQKKYGCPKCGHTPRTTVQKHGNKSWYRCSQCDFRWQTD